MFDRSDFAVLALCAGLLAGCNGCESRSAQPAAPPAQSSAEPPATTPLPVSPERSKLDERLAKRKLDRAKVYPRGEDGSVQCARDVDCFIVQAEHCTPALLEHARSVSGFGVERRIASTFHISGQGETGCKLERRVTELRVRMATKLEQMLRDQEHQSDAELQKMRDTMLTALRERNPPEVACELSSDQMLTLALDLAEGRFEANSLASCTERPAPEPVKSSASSLAPEASHSAKADKPPKKPPAASTPARE
jgi:hypothetical protein